MASGLVTVSVAMISVQCAAAAIITPAAASSVRGHPTPPARHHRPPGSPAPAASQPKVPSLSISVTDGRTTAMPGDRLAYRLRVDNSGAIAARALTITLTTPPYLRSLSAGGGGVVTAGKVTWHARLPAGHAATFTMSALLAPAPAGVSRLAAVACAAMKGGRPVVCAAHLDRLAAVASTAGRTGASGPGRKTAGSPLGYVLAITAALATGVAAMLLRRRQRSARPLPNPAAPVAERRSGH